MTKVHAQGGHGRFFKEQRDKAASIENAKLKIQRAQEARQRQLTEHVKKQVDIVGEKFSKEVIPVLEKVKGNLEERAKRGGITKEAFIIRILAMEDYALQEIKRRMSENETIRPYLKELDLSEYRSLSSKDRAELLTLIIGKKPSVSRQRSILTQIQQLSKEVPRWALGAI